MSTRLPDWSAPNLVSSWKFSVSTRSPLGGSAGSGGARRAGEGEVDAEGCALARVGSDLHRSLVGGHERRHDGQAQSGTTVPRSGGPAGPGLVDAVEALEDPLGLLLGEPGPGVAHLDHG